MVEHLHGSGRIDGRGRNFNCILRQVRLYILLLPISLCWVSLSASIRSFRVLQHEDRRDLFLIRRQALPSDDDADDGNDVEKDSADDSEREQEEDSEEEP
jgi:hypothetical protein